MSKAISCICCGKTSEDLRKEYPLRVRIVQDNDYNLPVGKVLAFARRKEGDASPFPIEIRGNWPNFFHGALYQMREDEVEIVDDE